MSSSTLHFFLSFKESIIWTGVVGPVMSFSVIFSHRFLLIFFSITEDIVIIHPCYTAPILDMTYVLWA